MSRNFGVGFFVFVLVVVGGLFGWYFYLLNNSGDEILLGFLKGVIILVFVLVGIIFISLVWRRFSGGEGQGRRKVRTKWRKKGLSRRKR
jgi:hypothetical protein